MKYKAALFDLDGVIIDSEPLHVQAFKQVLEKYGKVLSDDQYKQYFAGKTDKEGFAAYFNNFPVNVELSVIQEVKNRAYEQLASIKLEPYPGIVNLIRTLSARMPLALVTGSLSSEARIALKACGVLDSFAVIVSADDIKNGKPDPEGYLKAALLLEVNPENCVVIEDSPSGIFAAKRAGIDCIAVTTTHTREELSNATTVTDKLSINMF